MRDHNDRMWTALAREGFFYSLNSTLHSSSANYGLRLAFYL